MQNAREKYISGNYPPRLEGLAEDVGQLLETHSPKDALSADEIKTMFEGFSSEGQSVLSPAGENRLEKFKNKALRTAYQERELQSSSESEKKGLISKIWGSAPARAIKYPFKKAASGFLSALELADRVDSALVTYPAAAALKAQFEGKDVLDAAIRGWKQEERVHFGEALKAMSEDTKEEITTAFLMAPQGRAGAMAPLGALSPQKRRETQKFLKEHASEDATNLFLSTVGLGADILTAPSTWVTFGAGKVADKIVVAGKRLDLTKRGLKVFNKLKTQYLDDISKLYPKSPAAREAFQKAADAAAERKFVKMYQKGVKGLKPSIRGVKVAGRRVVSLEPLFEKLEKIKGVTRAGLAEKFPRMVEGIRRAYGVAFKPWNAEELLKVTKRKFVTGKGFMHLWEKSNLTSKGKLLFSRMKERDYPDLLRWFLTKRDLSEKLKGLKGWPEAKLSLVIEKIKAGDDVGRAELVRRLGKYSDEFEFIDGEIDNLVRNNLEKVVSGESDAFKYFIPKGKVIPALKKGEIGAATKYGAGKALRTYEKGLRWWKGATITGRFRPHLRNPFGDILNMVKMNAVDPVDLKNAATIMWGQRKYAEEFVDPIQFANWAEGRLIGDVSEQDLRLILSSMDDILGGGFVSKEVAERGAAEAVWKLPDFPGKEILKKVGTAPANVAQAGEDWRRLSVFLHGLKETGSAEKAMDLVDLILFDYTPKTLFRRFGKDVIPFLQWYLENLKLQAHMWSHRPGVQILPQKIREEFELPKGTALEEGMPEFIQKGGGVRVGRGQRKYFLWANWTPASEISTPFNPLDTLFSRLTPALKIPIEQKTGKSLSFTEQFRRGGREKLGKFFGWTKFPKADVSLITGAAPPVNDIEKIYQMINPTKRWAKERGFWGDLAMLLGIARYGYSQAHSLGAPGIPKRESGDMEEVYKSALKRLKSAQEFKKLSPEQQAQVESLIKKIRAQRTKIEKFGFDVEEYDEIAKEEAKESSMDLLQMFNQEFTATIQKQLKKVPPGELSPILTSQVTPTGKGRDIKELKADNIQVLDGDTIRTANYGKIRFLDIDTKEIAHPEWGLPEAEAFADEATNQLTKWIQDPDNKIGISFPEGEEATGEYGRKLAYIWINNVLAQSRLTGLGLAEPFFFGQKGPETKLQKSIAGSAGIAKESGLGIWGRREKAPYRARAIVRTLAMPKGVTEAAGYYPSLEVAEKSSDAMQEFIEDYGGGWRTAVEEAQKFISLYEEGDLLAAKLLKSTLKRQLAEAESVDDTQEYFTYVEQIARVEDKIKKIQATRHEKQMENIKAQVEWSKKGDQAADKAYQRYENTLTLYEKTKKYRLDEVDFLKWKKKQLEDIMEDHLQTATDRERYEAEIGLLKAKIRDAEGKARDKANREREKEFRKRLRRIKSEADLQRATMEEQIEGREEDKKEAQAGLEIEKNTLNTMQEELSTYKDLQVFGIAIKAQKEEIKKASEKVHKAEEDSLKSQIQLRKDQISHDIEHHSERLQQIQEIIGRVQDLKSQYKDNADLQMWAKDKTEDMEDKAATKRESQMSDYEERLKDEYEQHVKTLKVKDKFGKKLEETATTLTGIGQILRENHDNRMWMGDKELELEQKRIQISEDAEDKKEARLKSLRDLRRTQYEQWVKEESSKEDISESFFQRAEERLKSIRDKEMEAPLGIKDYYKTQEWYERKITKLRMSRADWQKENLKDQRNMLEDRFKIQEEFAIAEGASLREQISLIARQREEFRSQFKEYEKKMWFQNKMAEFTVDILQLEQKITKEQKRQAKVRAKAALKAAGKTGILPPTELELFAPGEPGAELLPEKRKLPFFAPKELSAKAKAGWEEVSEAIGPIPMSKAQEKMEAIVEGGVDATWEGLKKQYKLHRDFEDQLSNLKQEKLDELDRINESEVLSEREKAKKKLGINTEYEQQITELKRKHADERKKIWIRAAEGLVESFADIAEEALKKAAVKWLLTMLAESISTAAGAPGAGSAGVTAAWAGAKSVSVPETTTPAPETFGFDYPQFDQWAFVGGSRWAEDMIKEFSKGAAEGWSGQMKKSAGAISSAGATETTGATSYNLEINVEGGIDTQNEAEVEEFARKLAFRIDSIKRSGVAYY